MIDTVQLILILVIVLLSVLLFVLGIQVYFILKDLRQTITKANKVLDNANDITENVSGPLASLSSLASGVKTGTLVTVAKVIKSFLSKDEDKDERNEKRN